MLTTVPYGGSQRSVVTSLPACLAPRENQPHDGGFFAAVKALWAQSLQSKTIHVGIVSRNEKLKVRVEKQVGAQTLSLETGFYAKQAAASVIVQYGDTVVLDAVTTGPPRLSGDFFPLTCDYRERTAAAGKFPGGFIKREGRPTIKETLTSRLMDRPIRPLFPAGFYDEVQIQAMVLSSDRQYDPDVLAMNGASAACCLSPLPFQGPIAAVRLGQINGEFVVFPSQDQLEESDLDLIISGSKDAILMIEGFAREMPEDRMAEAILEAHRHVREICELQEEMLRKCNIEKPQFEPPPDDGVLA